MAPYSIISLGHDVASCSITLWPNMTMRPNRIASQPWCFVPLLPEISIPLGVCVNDYLSKYSDNHLCAMSLMVVPPSTARILS